MSELMTEVAKWLVYILTGLVGYGLRQFAQLNKTVSEIKQALLGYGQNNKDGLINRVLANDNFRHKTRNWSQKVEIRLQVLAERLNDLDHKGPVSFESIDEQKGAE